MDEMIDVTFGDLESKFLVLPKGNGFVEYKDFQTAYEVLKSQTNGFKTLTKETSWAAFEADSLAFVVMRTILGFQPPEWAELARDEVGSDISTGAARTLDVAVRKDRQYLKNARHNGKASVHVPRINALIEVAINLITGGAPAGAADTVHRLAKVDTSEGLISLIHAAEQHVPYSVLLYERFLGRSFASHRDSISEIIGDIMESAVESRLTKARITFRRTKRAERVPGWEQAPDFFVPTEFVSEVAIEAKITSDDGTARDKVARILNLAHMRDQQVRAGEAGFQLVACIDGRGFGVRREDMRKMLVATEGKVFTLATLDKLIPNTRLQKYVPKVVATTSEN